MRLLLLCTAFNGLSQRVWLDLRGDGHDVRVRLSGGDAAIRRAVAEVDPELIICPYLRERVPRDVWQRYRTLIVHPGPPGDRGPSSLDWAIADGATSWGVTVLEARDEMDAGPVWASQPVAMPDEPPRKSSLYTGPVTDAAVAALRDAIDRVGAGAAAPAAAARIGPGVLRPLMRQVDRAFAWSDTTAHIVRRVCAADGAPGVRSTVAGVPVSVFDARPGPAVRGEPGTLAGTRHGAVLVHTGDGSVWIGQLRDRSEDVRGPKVPSTLALAGRVAHIPELLTVDGPHGRAAPSEIRYERHGPVGVLSFDAYNGALSTGVCRRLVRALRRAAAQDTRVLVLRGGEVFANGIHLGVIEAATDPEAAAWRNLLAIDEVCRTIITCTRQVVVAAIGGSAGAGGVMLALGADRVLLRDGVVLNPHYATMGLFGSEYWTYVLPRRVGFAGARRLTDRCLPIGASDALAMGLADAVLGADRSTFDDAVVDHARALAHPAINRRVLAVKRTTRDDDERVRPLETYRMRELAEMSRDIFDDRAGFAAARRALLARRQPGTTPAHLLAADDDPGRTPRVADEAPVTRLVPTAP